VKCREPLNAGLAGDVGVFRGFRMFQVDAVRRGPKSMILLAFLVLLATQFLVYPTHTTHTHTHTHTPRRGKDSGPLQSANVELSPEIFL
jgi:hypothetical protein